MKKIFLGLTALAVLVLFAAGPALAEDYNYSNYVSVTNGSYSPETITVPVGTTVTWTNNGTVQHTVTADDDLFDSGLLDVGGTFSYTFNEEGTFPYYCIPHGGPGGEGMSGTVIVTDYNGGGDEYNDGNDDNGNLSEIINLLRDLLMKMRLLMSSDTFEWNM